MPPPYVLLKDLVHCEADSSVVTLALTCCASHNSSFCCISSIYASDKALWRTSFLPISRAICRCLMQNSAALTSKGCLCGCAH